jgi:arginase
MRQLLKKSVLQNFVPVQNRSRPKIGLIGIMEDRNSSFLQGPSRAPDLIRKYFLEAAVNSWSELGIDVHDSIIDFGNVIPSKSNHAHVFRQISPQLEEMQEVHNLTPLTLGGDHSITFSMCKAVKKRVGKPLVIVHFDAHPDIYENFENNPDSHASPFARILETPDLCQQLISIGIRTLNGEQAIQIKKYGVKMIEAKDFPLKGFDILDILKTYITSDDTPVYISFDLDVIEPVRKETALFALSVVELL